MHFIDRIALVAAKEIRQPLVFGRAHEMGPVEVGRVTREMILFPVLVEGTGPGRAQLPHDVERSQACRLRALLRIGHQPLRVFDIRHRHAFFTHYVYRFHALADRVEIEAVAAEGVLVIDRHMRERLRRGRPDQRAPVTVADDGERFLQIANPQVHLVGGDRLATRRVIVTHHQHLGPRFRHALIDDSRSAEVVGKKLPEFLLQQHIRIFVQGEAQQVAYRQMVSLLPSEWLGLQAYLEWLKNSHISIFSSIRTADKHISPLALQLQYCEFQRRLIFHEGYRSIF